MNVLGVERGLQPLKEPLRILDLFSGAGGAAWGIHLACKAAGVRHEIIGVDIVNQPRYPFQFRLANAMHYPLENFDFIWASPPCQKYTSMRALGKGAGDNAPDLVHSVRHRLVWSNRPYCIENVNGAPLIYPLTLCGSMFGLRLRRHRVFESNFMLLKPSCTHDPQLRIAAVYGDHPEKSPIHRRRDIAKGRHDGPTECTWRACSVSEASEAMGIDWMVWRELTQAVPPAYSEFIFKQFLNQAGM